jgi:hypothetical protein
MRRAPSKDCIGDGNGDDSFASTLNAIEQRSSTKSKKKQRADVEQLDHAEEDDDELGESLKLMEEETRRLDGTRVIVFPCPRMTTRAAWDYISNINPLCPF